MTNIPKTCQHVDFTEAMDGSRTCLGCGLETSSCAINDLRTEAVMVVGIDGGRPVQYEPCEPPSEDQEYWCVGCDHSFSSWDEAVAHLAEQIPEAA